MDYSILHIAIHKCDTHRLYHFQHSLSRRVHTNHRMKKRKKDLCFVPRNLIFFYHSLVEHTNTAVVLYSLLTLALWGPNLMLILRLSVYPSSSSNGYEILVYNLLFTFTMLEIKSEASDTENDFWSQGVVYIRWYAYKTNISYEICHIWTDFAVWCSLAVHTNLLSLAQHTYIHPTTSNLHGHTDDCEQRNTYKQLNYV